MTDIVMPNREGIETIQTVKSEFPSTAIIAVSGNIGPDKEYLEWARNVGADDCMTKPLNATQLVAKLKQFAYAR
jgi:YesN/AraC family two-component response regulator